MKKKKNNNIINKINFSNFSKKNSILENVGYQDNVFMKFLKELEFLSNDIRLDLIRNNYKNNIIKLSFNKKNKFSKQDINKRYVRAKLNKINRYKNKLYKFNSNFNTKFKNKTKSLINIFKKYEKTLKKINKIKKNVKKNKK